MFKKFMTACLSVLLFSVLELVGHPSVQQSSSMGIKVSMGKQVYDVHDKGDFSFVLASLRDNLRVTIHDSEGNEIANTGVESRSIVEKGMWDDIFPLQGGGHVHMRLHFILTEEEQKKIRSMRESAARKKQEDLLKRSHSSADLAAVSGGSSAPPGDSEKTSDQVQDDIVNPAGSDRQPHKTCSGSSVKAPSQVNPDQKKQTFSTSKSTGALDKLPGYQHVKKQIQHRKEEQQSQLDRAPSSVRNMILAFESSPLKDASPATNITRETTEVSSITTTDIPLKAPKKTIPVRAIPILSKLEIVPAPISEEKATERAEVMTDIALKSQKMIVSVNAEPISPSLETIHAPTSKEIVSERDEIVDSRLENSCSTTRTVTPLKAPQRTANESTNLILSNLETLPTSTLEDIVEGVEVGECLDACQAPLVQNIEPFMEIGFQSSEQISNEKNVSQTQPWPAADRSMEEIISPNKLLSSVATSGQSTCSWKTLSRELPRHEKQNSSSFDSSVFEKTWRSKHRKSHEHKLKYEVSCAKQYYSSGSFRGWIFLEEIIYSCVQSDDRPLIDLHEGGYSGCSRDTIQEKVKDTDSVPIQDEKVSVEARASESCERPDSRPHIRQIRQAVNIAIVAGFGILVFLTRQRK